MLIDACDWTSVQGRFLKLDATVKDLAMRQVIANLFRVSLWWCKLEIDRCELFSIYSLLNL